MEKTERQKNILALTKVAVATFTAAKWREYGVRTRTLDQIDSHARLLRSLKWGDPDYEEHAFWAIEMMVNASSGHLELLNRELEPREWLRLNDPKLFSEFYSGEAVSLDDIEKHASILDIAEFNRHAKRIRQSIDEDPEQAIGSSKELLETTFKAIIEASGIKVSGKEDLGELWKLARKRIPEIQNSEAPKDVLRRLEAGLNQIVASCAEIRNLHGTGHGRCGSKIVATAEAKLVVNSAITLATYLLDMRGSEGQQNYNS